MRQTGALTLGIFCVLVSIAFAARPAVAAPSDGGKRGQQTASASADKSKPPSGAPTQSEDQAAQGTDPNGSGCGDGFGGLECRVTQLKDPATILIGSLSAVGVLIGAGLLGIGQQGGVRIMALSAAAGGGIFVCQGVITVLTRVS
jgi:hypothetical protein